MDGKFISQTDTKLYVLILLHSCSSIRQAAVMKTGDESQQ